MQRKGRLTGKKTSMFLLPAVAVHGDRVIANHHKVLFVVYTERGEALRLITARAATPNERSEYYGREHY